MVVGTMYEFGSEVIHPVGAGSEAELAELAVTGMIEQHTAALADQTRTILAAKNIEPDFYIRESNDPVGWFIGSRFTNAVDAHDMVISEKPRIATVTGFVLGVENGVCEFSKLARASQYNQVQQSASRRTVLMIGGVSLRQLQEPDSMRSEFAVPLQEAAQERQLLYRRVLREFMATL